MLFVPYGLYLGYAMVFVACGKLQLSETGIYHLFTVVKSVFEPVDLLKVYYVAFFPL